MTQTDIGTFRSTLSAKIFLTGDAINAKTLVEMGGPFPVMLADVL